MFMPLIVDILFKFYFVGIKPSMFREYLFIFTDWLVLIKNPVIWVLEKSHTCLMRIYKLNQAF